MRTRLHTCRGGTRLAYWDIGEGPVLVFSHGLLLSKEMYRDQVEALCDRYRCIAWDHPGQGESDPVPGSVTTMDQCAELAAELIEALEVGPVHFVGLSMGGYTGMRLAARRPELVASLINLATTARPEPEDSLPRYRLLNGALRLLGARGFLADQVLPVMFGASFMADPERAEQRATWRAEVQKNRRHVYRSVNGVLYRSDIRSEVPAIRAPCLHLQGAEDTGIREEWAQETVDLIPGARLQRIERAGHSMTVENPAAVTAAIEAFISEVTA